MCLEVNHFYLRQLPARLSILVSAHITFFCFFLLSCRDGCCCCSRPQDRRHADLPARSPRLLARVHHAGATSVRRCGDVPADRRVAYLSSAMRDRALTVILSVFGPAGIPHDADWNELLGRLSTLFNPPELPFQRDQRLNALDLSQYSALSAAVDAYHAAIAACTTPVTTAQNTGFFLNFTRRFPSIYIELDRHLRANPDAAVDAMIALLYSLQPLFAAGPSAPPAAGRWPGSMVCVLLLGLLDWEGVQLEAYRAVL